MKVSLVLLYLNTKYKGNWDKTYTHIKAKKPCPPENEVNEFLAKKKINPSEWVSLIDDGYPEILRRVVKPPFVMNVNSESYRLIQQIQSLFDSME